MKAMDKAALVVATFPRRGWQIPKEKGWVSHQLEVDFAYRQDWLSPDEEIFLRLLGAVNVLAYTGGWDGSPLEYTDNLNTACAGWGMFRFEDDEEGEESLPIPSPRELVLVG